MSSHVGFREAQHSYTNMAKTRSLCIRILKEVSVELNNEIRKRKVFQLWQFQTPFFVCEKWLVIFVISKFFFADQCSQTIDNCWWPTVICNAESLNSRPKTLAASLQNDFLLLHARWLITVFPVTYWITAFHCPATLHFQLILNRKWNLDRSCPGAFYKNIWWLVTF